MVKKQKDETPNIHSTPNRDIIQRLNFLYQASIYLQSLEPPACELHPILPKSKGKNKSQITDDTSNQTQYSGGKKKKHRRKRSTGDLSRGYVQSMRIIGQKTTVKIDPALKRSLCASCNTTLIPGLSASVRVKKSSSHGHLVIYTCLHCKSSKSIPAPPTLPLNPAVELESNLLNTPTVVLSASQSESSESIPSQVQKQEKKRRKESILASRPRLLPLFARPDAGHVVFKGNEVVALDQGGLGVCFI